MKNFRKVLALVLVVAMMFSFAAMASAKELKDYTDAESVSYDTAVEILSALEILNGYEDGSFKPTNSISREEMAKMIAVLANAGDADVDSLYAAACEFADVEKDRWSASYISYCAYTGIVAGVGENCFNPYGNVTALETAKMLLVLMGFDADEQGYVGANWKINVLTDAQNFGLTAGFPAGYDWNDAISREEAAQMMLNALNANVIVGVISENVVKITNALYEGRKIDATLIDAKKYGDLKLYGNVIVDGDTTLASALYKGLIQNVPGRDCYGRPGTTWNFKNGLGNVVLSGSFVMDAAIAHNTDGTLKIADVVKAANMVAGQTYQIDMYVNGNLTPDLKDGDIDGNKNGSSLDENIFAAQKQVGKGVEIDIFVNHTTKTFEIIVKNTYIGQVTGLTTSQFQLNNGMCFSNKGYNFAKGDIILYWICDGHGNDHSWNGGQLHTAKVVTPVTTGVKKASDAKYIIGTDGNKYEYAAFLGVNTANTALSAYYMDQHEVSATAAGGTFDLYLDEFGYIMAFRATPAADPAVYYAYAVEGTGYFWDKQDYVTGTGAGSVEGEKTIVKYEDASEATLKVGSEAAWDALNYQYNSVTTLGTLVAYTESEGTITAALEAERMGVAGYSLSDGFVPFLAKNGNIGYMDKFGQFHVVAYGADDTQYMVRTYDYATGKYVYTTYTEDTLPNGFAGYTLVDTDKDGCKDTTVGTLQFFATPMDDADKTLIADVVFVDAIYGTADQARAFVTGKVESYSDIDFVDQFEAVDVYEGVVNGKEGYIVLNDTQRIEHMALFSSIFTCIGYNTEDGLPVYVAAYYVDPDTTGEALRYVRGELFYEGVLQEVDENCLVVVAFPAGYDNDATYTYSILENGIEGINKFYMDGKDLFHAAHCDKTGCDGCVFGDGWILDLDGDGDVDELYFEIWSTDALAARK